MAGPTDSGERFPAWLVRRRDDGTLETGVREIAWDELPAGEVLIEVDWSSINYKDALAAAAHPGVVRHLPHVPGVDAAGHVVASDSAAFQPGQPVVVTGNELGAGQWGGWSRYIRVPADWIVPLPDGLTLREAMVQGTAGFTAAQCVQRLLQNGVQPQDGPILVTGATGGVGCLAVQLLARLGYHVAAVSGKREQWDWLRGWGAAEVLDRDEVLPAANSTAAAKPLASARWAGVVDTVGGAILAAAIRATKPHGCVAACGNVAGTDLPLTVFPFILRGVALAGVTSQNCRAAERAEIWRKLAGEWKLTRSDKLAEEVDLEGLDAAVARVARGQVAGRIVVRVHSRANP
jgi:acrylyl-CoA reductase (NADPH)